MSSKIKYHFWVGHKVGIIMTMDTTPTKPIRNEKMKYIGTGTPYNWPKKMSTGRVFYEPKKLRKDQKTDTEVKPVETQAPASARKRVVTRSGREIKFPFV